MPTEADLILRRITESEDGRMNSFISKLPPLPMEISAATSKLSDLFEHEGAFGQPVVGYKNYLRSLNITGQQEFTITLALSWLSRPQIDGKPLSHVPITFDTARQIVARGGLDRLDFFHSSLSAREIVRRVLGVETIRS